MSICINAVVSNISSTANPISIDLIRPYVKAVVTLMPLAKTEITNVSPKKRISINEIGTHPSTFFKQICSIADGENFELFIVQDGMFIFADRNPFYVLRNELQK